MTVDGSFTLFADRALSPPVYGSDMRGFLFIGVLAVGGAMAAGAMTYDLVGRGDEHALALQRRLLQGAVAQAGSEADPAALARAADLPGLAFGDASAADGRAQQPLVDASGRIAGFFTWEEPHARRLLGMPAWIGGGSFGVLLVSGGIMLWRLRRARAELAQVKRAAETDRLTGLPNHARLLDLIEAALRARARDEALVFAAIEIDGLAEAQSGALGADELIAGIARRLRDAAPENALLGRLGDSQFGLAFALPLDADAEPALRAILDALAEPHWIDNVVRLGAALGFAKAPLHAAARNELTRRAEVALRGAVRKGPGSLVAFDPALDRSSAERKIVQRELPRALAAQEFELHFQPIVAAAGGGIVGVEALLRWTHPARGAIPPGVFIPVAEQMGLMDQLGAFVLRQALREATRWPDLTVAVNLSPMQVRHSGIVDMVRVALAESGVPPSRLMLEITEGVLVDDPEQMVHRIGDLHALGVRVALDDFGAGYSSLAYLQRFPLDKLKIDKSFVDALGTTENGGVILQAIVGLARALGLSVTAEGVETEQQRVLLRLAGCDELQGFLFAKPVPAKEIDRLVKRGQGKPPPALTA